MTDLYKLRDLCFYILHDETFDENDYTSQDYLNAHRFLDILNYGKPFTKKKLRERLDYCIKKHRFLIKQENN